MTFSCGTGLFEMNDIPVILSLISIMFLFLTPFFGQMVGAMYKERTGRYAIKYPWDVFSRPSDLDANEREIYSLYVWSARILGVLLAIMLILKICLHLEIW